MFIAEELNEAGIPERHHKATNIIFESFVITALLGFLAWAIF